MKHGVNNFKLCVCFKCLSPQCAVLFISCNRSIFTGSIRDCCECFVLKYTHALTVYNEREIFNTARSEAECSI